MARGSVQPPSGYAGGARAVAPLAIAVVGFGISFGVLARSAGMGVVAPVVFSATTFAGSSQFAAASVLEAGGEVAAAVVAAILLNARYGPIGLSVAPAFERSRWSRFLQAQLVVDESWAVANRGGGRFDRQVLVGAGLVLYAAWVGSTAIGVVAGDLLGDPEALGLDAAFPALFLALLAPQIRSRRAVMVAMLGGAVALALVPLAPPGVPIIAAAAACLVGWRRARPRPPTPEVDAPGALEPPR
jgi:4-azaleucine resistance transporter AzlC